MDPRWWVISLTNLLLVFLMGQINHSLSGYSVSLCLAGLMVPLAATRLRLGSGVAVMLLSGFFLDASRPTLFGANSILLLGIFAAWCFWRARLPRDGAATAIVGALVANFVLFIFQPIFVGAAAVLEAQDPNLYHWQPLLVQLKPFVIESLRAARRLASGAATADRILVDLLLSELAVAVLAPWFVALQERSLRLCGVNLAEEIREPGGAL